jgi:hypothetical protein
MRSLSIVPFEFLYVDHAFKPRIARIALDAATILPHSTLVRVQNITSGRPQELVQATWPNEIDLQ